MFNILKFLKYYLFQNAQKINYSPQKILIIRNDHIGDVCVSLPFVNSIKFFFPDCEVHILINVYTLDIISGNPNIDKIIIQNKDDAISDIINKIPDNYDILFNLTSTKFNAKLSKKINAKYKIGYAYKIYNIFAFNRYVFTHRQNPPIHECDFCFEFLKLCNIDFLEKKQEIVKNTVIYVNDYDKKYVDEYWQKLKFDNSKKNIGIHPGDNKSAFNWSLKKYIELAEYLAQDFEIVFIFGPAELALMNDELFKIKQRVYNFKIVEGNLTVKQLAYFIKKLNCLVSGSTGPMHIAGLMDTPTVSIFSNKLSHNYKKWHPLNNKFEIIEPQITSKKSEDIKKNIEQIPISLAVEKIKKIIN